MTHVEFYLDHRGKNPVGDFLDKNKNIKVKAIIIIKNIIEFGLTSSVPHLKKLTGLPLSEIRILGKDSARILYAHQSQDKIVLLHAFRKNRTKLLQKKSKLL